jgi:D-glycero-alpha-D-manno-heptose 1-phosphate guanylyltransferase
MNMEEIQTILLCGGLGSRLKNLYPDLPKALVPVAGKPFLEWQIGWLASQGIKKIHLAAGYKAKLLHEWLAISGSAKFSRLTFSFSEEPAPLGTGGGLAYAAKQIKASSFLALNGDTLLPSIALNNFIKFCEGATFEAIIAVVKVKESSRFGTINFDENCRLRSFNEKSQNGDSWINAGIYFFKNFSLNNLQFPKSFSIEKDFFPAMLKENKIGVFPVEGELFDMGTPEGIRELTQFLLSSNL